MLPVEQECVLWHQLPFEALSFFPIMFHHLLEHCQPEPWLCHKRISHVPTHPLPLSSATHSFSKLCENKTEFFFLWLSTRYRDETLTKTWLSVFPVHNGLLCIPLFFSQFPCMNIMIGLLFYGSMLQIQI